MGALEEKDRMWEEGVWTVGDAHGGDSTDNHIMGDDEVQSMAIEVRWVLRGSSTWM